MWHANSTSSVGALTPEPGTASTKLASPTGSCSSCPAGPFLDAGAAEDESAGAGRERQLSGDGAGRRPALLQGDLHGGDQSVVGVAGTARIGRGDLAPGLQVDHVAAAGRGDLRGAAAARRLEPLRARRRRRAEQLGRHLAEREVQHGHELPAAVSASGRIRPMPVQWNTTA